MLPQLGIDGQRRLLASSVLLVGVGGLGSAVATYICGAGIGRIGLADNDVVSLSNLQRQTLYTEAEIGRPKVLMAAERLRAMNSEICVETFGEGIGETNAAEIFSRYDLIVDCCDNFATRFLIDDTCSALGKPWVHGAISEFAGQVSVFNLSRGRRYRELYPDRDYLCALPRTAKGVIGAVPGFVGSLQAAEAIKILGGFGRPLEGRLLVIDCLEASVQEIEF